MRTFLRVHRGDQLSITDVALATGLARGEISMLERGQQLPRDEWLRALELVYGDRARWYPAGVANVLLPDLAVCPGCGDELAPDASRRRIYHNDRCRSRARRLAA